MLQALDSHKKYLNVVVERTILELEGASGDMANTVTNYAVSLHHSRLCLFKLERNLWFPFIVCTRDTPHVTEVFFARTFYKPRSLWAG